MCLRLLIFIALAWLGLAAAVHAESDAEAAARLRGEIDQLVGDAPCSNVVNCRVLGLGAHACGGPEEYVAYSTWTRRDEIEGKAMEYSFLREELLAHKSPAGGCAMLPEPHVACVNRRCLTVPTP